MGDQSNPSPQQRINRLEHRLRRLQIITVSTLLLLAAAVGVSVVGGVYAGTPSHTLAHSKNAEFNTVTVKRINVVAPDGTPRLVISNAAEEPPPIANGKTLKREVTSAGILFYNEDGNETGGIAVARRPNGTKQAALVFDYNRSEAIALVKQQHGEHAKAGLIVMAPPSASSPLGIDGPERITVQTVSGKAEVALSDTKGTPRLRLVVPRTGDPVIQFLDVSGKVVREISANGKDE